MGRPGRRVRCRLRCHRSLLDALAPTVHARPPMPERRHRDQPQSLPPVVYEREPGAAFEPLPADYRPRNPQATVLYKVVQDHLETLLEEGRQRSESLLGYPAFIEHEFRRYLSCGDLSRGMARARCPQCGYERLVPPSCKGRFCPSCAARRAADIAAHLVDRLLPEARYRQFVLTFPWELHFLLSVDRQFMTRMLTAYLQSLFAWQRWRGRRLGIEAGQTGAITFIQRFNASLGLFPHLHSIVPDGLFVPHDSTDGQQHLQFVALPPPDDDDLSRLTSRIARALRRTELLLGALGIVEDLAGQEHAAAAESELEDYLRQLDREQLIAIVLELAAEVSEVGRMLEHRRRMEQRDAVDLIVGVDEEIAAIRDYGERHAYGYGSRHGYGRRYDDLWDDDDDVVVDWSRLKELLQALLDR